MAKKSKLTPMPHSLIIKEISRDTRLRPEIVEAVLNRYIDIAVEQIVNEKGFKMKGVFSVNYHMSPQRRSPRGDEIIPPRSYAQLKLSKNVKDLYTLRNLFYLGKEYVINRDTWAGAIRWMWSPEHKEKVAQARREQRANALKAEIPQSFPRGIMQGDKAADGVAVDTYNPFLDDDE